MNNYLLQDDMAPEPVRPPCYNRPPIRKTYSRFGLDSQTGEVIEKVLSNKWFEDKCRTWDGVGIGQPTAEYQSGTPYPIAHGWAELCKSCRWLPEDRK